MKKHHDSEQTASPSIREQLSLRVMKKALESGTKESTKFLGTILLSHALPAAIAGPTADVLAAVTSDLVAAMLKQTDTIDKRLKTIISEPLHSAEANLRLILSAQMRSSAEMRQCMVLLNQVFDNLQRAYSYAEKDDVDKCQLIRLYQVLTTALMEGGEPFTKVYLNELTLVITSARDEAKRLDESAQKYKAEQERLSTQYSKEVARYMPFLPGHVHGIAAESMLCAQKAKELPVEAEALRQYASELEAFCSFIRILSKNRVKILKSAKKIARKEN